MAAQFRPLTRDQLSRICNGNQEAIRAFEKLFQQAGDVTPADVVILFQIVQEVAIEAADALAEAQNALASLQLLSDSLGLEPRQEIGTLAVQNADQVTVGSLTATGDINAANFIASGDVDAVNVNASGDVAAVNVNASGDVGAVNVVASGDVDAVNVDASGNVGAVDVNASGDVAAVNVNASGDVGALNVNATGNVEAATYSVNGNAGASGTGTTITAITVENGIVTAITVT